MIKKWEKIGLKTKLFIKLHKYNVNLFDFTERDINNFANEKFLHQQENFQVKDILLNANEYFETLEKIMKDTAKHYEVDLIEDFFSKYLITPREDILKNLRKKINETTDNSHLLLESLSSTNRIIKKELEYNGFEYVSFIKKNYSDRVTLKIAGNLNDKIKDNLLSGLEFQMQGSNKDLVYSTKNFDILNNYFQKYFNTKVKSFEVFNLRGQQIIRRFYVDFIYEDAKNFFLTGLSRKKEVKEEFEDISIINDISNFEVGFGLILKDIKENNLYELKEELSSFFRFYARIADYHNFESDLLNKLKEKQKANIHREKEIKKLKAEASQKINIKELSKTIDRTKNSLLKWVAKEGFDGIDDFNPFGEILTFKIIFNFKNEENINFLLKGINQTPIEELEYKYEFEKTLNRYFLKLNEANIKKITNLISKRFPTATITNFEVNNIPNTQRFYIKHISIRMENLIDL